MLKKTKTKFIIILSVLLLGGLFLFSFQFVMAQLQTDVGLGKVEKIGLSKQDIRITIANYIRIFLGFIGIIAVIISLYAGYLIMTAGGNPDKVNQGKKILQNGVIGILIIVSSYALVSFVISILQGNLSQGSGGIKKGIPAFKGGILSGSSIIESHYPARGAVGVPRNTKIMVTFREPIDPSSIVDDNNTPNNLTDDKLKTEAVQIRRESDDPKGPFVAARAAYTPDFKTFVFAPNELLGVGNESIKYVVTLTSAIKKKNGQPAFSVNGKYEWSFEVGTYVDNTPPQVSSVFPIPNREQKDPLNPKSYPRNVIIQINFSEAMDPTTVVGTTANNFQNITVNIKQGLVEGGFRISNQYRTVEFITNDLCGTNSCGQDVYCLPGDETISTLLKAASVEADKAPAANFPYDGIVDAAGNSLDGNKNGKAEGQGVDNYFFKFNTSNKIDLVPPKIIATQPVVNSSDVDLSAPVKALFDKVISFSTVNKDNIILEGVNYWVGGELEKSKEVKGKTDNDTMSSVQIFHDQFSENTEYNPQITSGVTDIYQNCYNPCVGP